MPTYKFSLIPSSDYDIIAILPLIFDPRLVDISFKINGGIE